MHVKTLFLGLTLSLNCCFLHFSAIKSQLKTLNLAYIIDSIDPLLTNHCKTISYVCYMTSNSLSLNIYQTLAYSSPILCLCGLGMEYLCFGKDYLNPLTPPIPYQLIRHFHHLKSSLLNIL